MQSGTEEENPAVGVEPGGVTVNVHMELSL